MKNNIILIGFMGAGKTSVGETLSAKYGMELLDTDQLIEKKAGMTISKIFAEQGEDSFRALETGVLKELLAGADHTVVSVGGGLPLREENRAVLKQLGAVIYLKVKPETVLERLKGDTTRPLLQGGDVERRVNDLLEYRSPVYESAAHRVIEVDGLDLDEIADEIYRITYDNREDEGKTI